MFNVASALLSKTARKSGLPKPAVLVRKINAFIRVERLVQSLATVRLVENLGMGGETELAAPG
jgi:hypothetical protein